MIIGGVVIAVLFFWAGTAFAKHKSVSATPAMGMQGARGNFAGGTMRNGAAAGGFVSGTVLSKTDTTITVQNQAGGSKIILVSPSTAVSKSAQGSITDVAVGSSILATGSTNSDGSITAQTLQLRPEGATPDRR
ncbi:MAG: hypothetical protein JWL92_351 [Candidatus Nomurabacteria bacterium]|nr:hypothetical protein [Candidatus Nomurabacteria bacterium]